ncbi:hypothetical protein [Streptomyces europaeiscabiei]|uniref:hypothetical protein n=1 Tax=Streptomyces europaeiscabiei TaxID=146819 RepID=UPI0038F72DB4
MDDCGTPAAPPRWRKLQAALSRRCWPWPEASTRTGRTFSAGWGTTETLNVTLVRPELVAEVGVAWDSVGRWRHPARWYRARPGLSPGDVVIFGHPG